MNGIPYRKHTHTKKLEYSLFVRGDSRAIDYYHLSKDDSGPQYLLNSFHCLRSVHIVR